jgi:spore coat polysaccharide biosynthesis protein SpsF (cytidylyltransferase family)
MTTAVIIQARLASTRLPNKALADINGHPMLWHVVNRARRIPSVDSVCVATSFSEADQRLIDWCQREGIPVLRGGNGENDVLGRYFDVATQLGADVVMRVTGDCPCLEPGIACDVLTLFHKEGAEYASNVEVPYIDGTDCEVFSFELLAKAHEKATEPAEREHVSTWMRKHAKRKARLLREAPTLNVKLSVDTAEELDLVRAMFADLGDDFGLAEALEWWEKRGKGKDKPLDTLLGYPVTYVDDLPTPEIVLGQYVDAEGDKECNN